MTPSGQIAHLYRYPVKGLSPEPVSEAKVEVGKGFPLNRRFALALPRSPFDGEAPAARPKTDFLMLQRDERLAELQTSYDETRGELTVARRGETLAVANLHNEAGRSAIEDFFEGFLADSQLGRPRLVSAPGFQFTDVSVVSEPMMRAISLINLASVAALEAELGKPLHHLRFRANVYFTKAPAWAEFDWVDRPILIGTVRAHVTVRTMRCAATEVNPETALRDCNVPLALQRAFGHRDMGVYAEVESDGLIREGDRIGLA